MPKEDREEQALATRAKASRPASMAPFPSRLRTSQWTASADVYASMKSPQADHRGWRASFPLSLVLSWSSGAASDEWPCSAGGCGMFLPPVPASLSLCRRVPSALTASSGSDHSSAVHSIAKSQPGPHLAIRIVPVWASRSYLTLPLEEWVRQSGIVPVISSIPGEHPVWSWRLGAWRLNWLGGEAGMSVEVIAMQVAHSLTSRAVQVWLDGRRREQERTLAMGDLVRLRIPGLRAQRSVERQFEQIADAVAARLEPLCVYEFPDLDGGSRQAAINLVVEVFRHADLSDQAIIGADANAAEWTRRLRVQAPPHRTLGEPASRFYELLLAECCECYVQILRRLPVFNERAITELLGRTTNLGAELNQILERLPARSFYAPGGSDHDEEFRSEYLGLISRELDEVELFSVLAWPAPRTILSVAYISLRVTANTDSVSRPKNRSEMLIRGGVGSWDEQDVEAASVRVETALKRSRRTLLLGEAGSGKTTLLSWLAVTAARRGFTGDLADWNELVPFLVKLRSYAGRHLPALDGFLDSTAAPLTGHMPRAWVDRQFKGGRALLMVYGVDELVPTERRKVRDWLRRLLYAYPTTHVVITSRPTAAQSDWLEVEEFYAVSLERMTPTDLRAFIRQWHDAVHARAVNFPALPRTCRITNAP